MKIKDKKYKFITDNSSQINPDGAFLLTSQNKKYMKDVEQKGYAVLLSPEELFLQWELDEIKTIAITGTNGKTTCSNLIAHILKNLGQKVAVSGTEGFFLHSKNKVEKITDRGNTTPDIFSTLLNLKKAKKSGAEFFVMEVSSHGIFQKRIEGLRFSAKLFTNLTQDHLDFHKTFKNYCDVKSSFFTDEDCFKIVNGDDENIRFNTKNSFLYSLEKKDSDLFAQNLNFESGICADVFFDTEKYFLKSSMIGKFNLYNILASVLTVRKITHFPFDEIIKSVGDFRGVEGRMEIIYKKKNIEVFTDYAHTPDAIKNVLKSIGRKKNAEKTDHNHLTAEHQKHPSDFSAKIITIVGAGGDRDSGKRAIMSQIACKNSDFVFLTSDNPRFENPKKILKDMRLGVKNFSNYQIIEDRKKAIFTALQKAEKISEKEKVIVAILGKGNENYIELKGKKIPYSDKEEVLLFFSKYVRMKKWIKTIKIFQKDNS